MRACSTFPHTLANVADVGGEDCVRPFQLCVCGTVKVFGGAKNISHCINVTWGSWCVCACSSVRQLCASFASGLKKTIHNIPGDSAAVTFSHPRSLEVTDFTFPKGSRELTIPEKVTIAELPGSCYHVIFHPITLLGEDFQFD